MNYMYAILQILNHPIHKEIKDGYTRGWKFTKQRKINNCYEIGFRCPRGKNIEDVEKLLPAIRAACGTEIELMDLIGVIVVRVCTQPLPRMIPFLPKMFDGLKPTEILIGYSITGERITFDWSLPHGIIAGETGMGKTDLIRMIVLSLLRDANCDICIVDLKMLSYLPFKNVPRIKVVTGINQAYNALLVAETMVKQRNVMVEEHGSRDLIKTFRKVVVIVDEAADISPSNYKGSENKDIREVANAIERCMATIARMGREVKVHLLYCTQYPTADVVSKAIKINCGMRLCSYVPTDDNSIVILEKPGAELLPAHPGRFIFKQNLYTTIQVPYVGDDDAWRKTLTEFKTEVTTGGDSKRSDKERNVVNGSFEDSDINNKTIEPTIFKQLESFEESQSGFGRTGTRKTGNMGMASSRKVLEIDLEGEKEIEWN